MFNSYQDLKNEIRAQTRDSSESDYSKRIDLAIQQVSMDFRQRLRSPYNTKRYELTPDSTGQASVGDDFLGAEYVAYNDTMDEWALDRFTGQQHVQIEQNDRSGKPCGYRLFGSSIRARPWNYDDTTGHLIVIEGYVRPDILKSGESLAGDEAAANMIRLLGNVGHLYLSGASWRMFEYKNDFEAATRWRDVYERDFQIVNTLDRERQA